MNSVTRYRSWRSLRRFKSFPVHLKVDASESGLSSEELQALNSIGLNETAQIFGAVDNIIDAAIVGWARREGRANPIRVVAIEGSSVIGRCLTDIQRSDLSGSYGFRMQCSKPIEMTDILTGKIIVFAYTQDGEGVKLGLYKRLIANGLIDAFRKSIGELSIAEMDQILLALAEHPTMAIRRDSILNLAGPDAGRDFLQQSIRRTISQLVEYSGQDSLMGQVGTMNVPLGLMSPDGSALVGKEGFVFLVGGSNAVLEQFTKNSESGKSGVEGDSWVQTIQRRAQFCKECSVDFLQCFIPEKMSVIPQFLPFALCTPSPLWQKLEESVDNTQGVKESTLFTLDLLKEQAVYCDVFPRLDTHLSAAATHAVFRAMLKHFGFDSPFLSPTFAREQIIVGDLAERFIPGVRIPEIGYMLSNEYKASLPSPILVERIEPGRHIGTRYVWKNCLAPIDKNVVVFGNSFFGPGDWERSLSWWFSRTFSEFHFLWSTELDHEYVQHAKPDIVVCQTIERFLPNVATV